MRVELVMLKAIRERHSSALWASIRGEFADYDARRRDRLMGEYGDRLMTEAMAARGKVYIPLTLEDYRRELRRKALTADSYIR